MAESSLQSSSVDFDSSDRFRSISRLGASRGRSVKKEAIPRMMARRMDSDDDESAVY